MNLTLMEFGVYNCCLNKSTLLIKKLKLEKKIKLCNCNKNVMATNLTHEQHKELLNLLNAATKRRNSQHSTNKIHICNIVGTYLVYLKKQNKTYWNSFCCSHRI